MFSRIWITVVLGSAVSVMNACKHHSPDSKSGVLSESGGGQDDPWTPTMRAFAGEYRFLESDGRTSTARVALTFASDAQDDDLQYLVVNASPTPERDSYRDPNWGAPAPLLKPSDKSKRMFYVDKVNGKDIIASLVIRGNTFGRAIETITEISYAVIPAGEVPSPSADGRPLWKRLTSRGKALWNGILAIPVVLTAGPGGTDGALTPIVGGVANLFSFDPDGINLSGYEQALANLWQKYQSEGQKYYERRYYSLKDDQTLEILVSGTNDYPAALSIAEFRPYAEAMQAQVREQCDTSSPYMCRLGNHRFVLRKMQRD